MVVKKWLGFGHKSQHVQKKLCRDDWGFRIEFFNKDVKSESGLLNQYSENVFEKSRNVSKWVCKNLTLISKFSNFQELMSGTITMIQTNQITSDISIDQLGCDWLK